MKVRAFKFNPQSDALEEDILKGRTPQEFLKEKYNRGCFFGLDNLQRYGLYMLMGWSYDFRPYMHKFVYKQYDHWQEIWAPNKTAVRKCTYGKIIKILEINPRHGKTKTKRRKAGFPTARRSGLQNSTGT